MMYKIKIKKIYLLIFGLVAFAIFTLYPSQTTYADPQGVGAWSTSYCSTKRHLTGTNLENCKKAWDCGYTYWRERDKDHCKNATNYQGLNIKKYVDQYPSGILADAIADGKKKSRSINVKSDSSGSSSDSGGGSSGSSGSTGSSASSSIDNNDQAKDKPSESGICKDNKKCSSSLTGGAVGSLSAPNGINKKDSGEIVAGILNIVYSLAAAIAVIVIVAAGIMYITSDGDPTKTSRAKNAIIYAAVGLVIVGSAFIITGIIQSIGAN